MIKTLEKVKIRVEKIDQDTKAKLERIQKICIEKMNGYSAAAKGANSPQEQPQENGRDHIGEAIGIKEGEAALIIAQKLKAAGDKLTPKLYIANQHLFGDLNALIEVDNNSTDITWLASRIAYLGSLNNDTKPWVHLDYHIPLIVTLATPDHLKTAFERLLTLSKLNPRTTRLECQLTDQNMRSAEFYAPCSLFLKAETESSAPLIKAMSVKLQVRLYTAEKPDLPTKIVHSFRQSVLRNCVDLYLPPKSPKDFDLFKHCDKLPVEHQKKIVEEFFRCLASLYIETSS